MPRILRKDSPIALLMGGPGSEHEVSLSSGQAVLEALRSEGFTALTPHIVTTLAPEIPAGTELCYNLIHGTYGEDGALQSYLDALHIPYTGAGAACSRLCFDKVATKRAMQEAHVPCPKDEVLTRDQIERGERPTLSLPCVVKPPREGSSVGVHIVRSEEELTHALQDVAQYGEEILVEEFIEGRELTVSVLDGKALPIVRISPRSGFYDMKNKYPSLYAGGAGSDYICPADLSEEETCSVQQAALQAYRALRVEVYGRVDVLLTADGRPYVLEINTIPGMTATSLFPKAAAAHGISYGELCTRIAEISLQQERG